MWSWLEGATLEPGERLGFRDLELMSAADGASLYTMNETFAVLGPLKPTVPSVVLAASSSAVGLCDDLILDGGGTRGSGGRTMTYAYAAESASGPTPWLPRACNVRTGLLGSPQPDTPWCAVVTRYRNA